MLLCELPSSIPSTGTGTVIGVRRDSYKSHHNHEVVVYCVALGWQLAAGAGAQLFVRERDVRHIEPRIEPDEAAGADGRSSCALQ